jgi:hypothetical protein
MGQAAPVCESEDKQNVGVIATAAAAAAATTTTTTTTTTTDVGYISVLLFRRGYLRTLSIKLHHNGIEW